MSWKDLQLRLRAVIFAGRVERELQEELESHMELQIRKNVAAGMGEAEARSKARVQFGGAGQIMEECREARGIDLITTALQDVRYALRSFRRNPIFALTVVATITLGLGLDSALFTIFNAYYFQAVPVRDPHSLYEVYWTDRAGNGHDFSWSEYREFLGENPAFSEALAYQHVGVRLDSREVTATLVNGEYFRMLGVSAALGRTLVPEDAVSPGQQPVIVLSYAEWQSHFAGDPQIVGKKVFLRGYPFEVVGVARDGFTGLGARGAAFWTPLTMAARFDAGPDVFGPDAPRTISIVGRLKEGIGVRQAQEGVTVWVHRFPAVGSGQDAPMRGGLISRASYKPWKPANTLLFAPILVAFSLVLLIGCANVANMMLARAMSRQREIGIRLSLGAARTRLIRQLLTESLLLALPAAAGGFALSYAAIRLCMRVLLATLPPGINSVATRIPALSPDFRVFAFGLAVAVVSAFLFGLVPALQATRTNIVQAARGEFAGDLRPSRLRNALVVGQIATCVVLLITSGVLLRGVDGIHRLDNRLSGKDTIQLAIQERFRTRVLDRLAADPDLEMLAAASSAPVERKLAVPLQSAEGGTLRRVASNAVSPDYFPVFEIPILQGRNFTREEAQAGAPVAIISQTAAQQLWPRGGAVGHSLRLRPDQTTDASLKRFQEVRVVGIAGDEISRWIFAGEDKALLYLPSNPRAAGTALYLRVRGNAEAKMRKLDADLASSDPLAVDQIQRIQIREWVNEEAFGFRVAYWLSLAIGMLALLLTLSGIYGVLAFVVSQRTQEIGIRIALGATAGSVTSLFLKQSIRLGLIGITLGCTLALGISRFLATVLVVSNTFDGVAYVGAMALVLGACAAAAFFPTRRAAVIDPLISLRYE